MLEITTDHILLYLQGKLNPEEHAAFIEKLETSAAFKKEAADLYYIWKAAEEMQMQKEFDTDTHWEKLSRKIAFSNFRKKLWNQIRTGAAILIIPLLTTTFFFNNINKTQTPGEETQTVTSAHGLVSKVLLADGSEIWLNSGSTLSYPLSFGQSGRKVKLEGEAYFKVKSDKKNRFDVETKNGLIVSAYGTEFNIRTYADEEYAEAVLVKGNVMLTRKGIPDQVYLNESQKGILYNDESGIRVSEANTQVKTAWKDGKMIFRRAGMKEVAERLSRHFNVDIQLNDKSLYEYEYNATFTNEPLVDILGLLKQSSPISYKIIDPVQLNDGSYSRKQVIISKNKKI